MAKSIILKKLDPRHHKAVTLMLDGVKGKEIADRLGVAEETVSRWKSDRLFAQHYEKQRAIWEEDFRDIRLGSLKQRLVDAEKEYNLLMDVRTQADNIAQVAAIFKQRQQIRQETREELARFEAKHNNGQLTDQEHARNMVVWLRAKKGQFGISLIDELVAKIEEKLA